MVHIDNVKMWESLMKHGHRYEYFEDAIPDALKDQGLTIKDVKIVSTEPEFKVEKGKWYMCTKDVDAEDGTIILNKKGKVYTGLVDDIISTEFEEKSYCPHIPSAYFRPATKEEIPQGPKPKPCDTCTMGTNNCALTCKKYNDYMNSQQNQESSDGELSEFEECMINYYVTGTSPIEGDDGKELIELTKKYEKKLFSIARKQIASEIDVNSLVEEYTNKWHDLENKKIVEIYEKNFHITIGIYKQAIEDVIKAVKGE